MSAEHNISGMFVLLFSLGFKFVNNFKKKLEMYFKLTFLHFT